MKVFSINSRPKSDGSLEVSSITCNLTKVEIDSIKIALHRCPKQQNEVVQSNLDALKETLSNY